MKHLLLVSELGGGFGHAKRLLPFAKAASTHGYRCTFVVANPHEVRSIIPREMSVQMRPVEKQQDPNLTNYDVSTLTSATKTWWSAIHQYSPTAIVCEYSPFLLFATHKGGIPVLSTGYGHILPHGVEVSRSMEQAAKTLGLPEMFEGTTEYFHGSFQYVTGLRALDPLVNKRCSGSIIGPVGTEARYVKTAPTKDVFAYLYGEHPKTTAILKALKRLKLSGSVYVRCPFPGQWQGKLYGSKLELLTSPANMLDEYRNAALIVHHGGTLMTEEAMIAGRPQVLIPAFPEHVKNAKALAGLGMTSSSTDLEDMLSEPLHPASAISTAASLWAKSYDEYRGALPSPWKLLQSIGVK